MCRLWVWKLQSTVRVSRTLWGVSEVSAVSRQSTLSLSELWVLWQRGQCRSTVDTFQRRRSSVKRCWTLQRPATAANSRNSSTPVCGLPLSSTAVYVHWARFPCLLESPAFFSWKFQDLECPGKLPWSRKGLEIKVKVMESSGKISLKVVHFSSGSNGKQAAVI